MKTLISALVLTGAAVLAFVTANASVALVEQRSEAEIRATLLSEGMDWAQVAASGLQVSLSGEAPTEALRFEALSAAGKVVDASRIVDQMETRTVTIAVAPRFSAELLRNSSGLSIIGLMPASTDRVAIVDRLQRRIDSPVTDLLETADYPAPPGWEDALAFGLSAVESLPRSKISIDEGRVSITAIADNAEEKAELEAKLRRAAPPALRVSLEVSAPRPVITPFTLRFVMDEGGARFDTCAADTDEARSEILDAAFRAGLTDGGRCVVGMGTPSTKWAKAASAAIEALAQLGGGNVTLSDADIALVAAEGTDPRVFDRVVGELENDLPEVFVLQALLPAVPDPDRGPAEFVATLSPEGQVQLRGRLSDSKMRTVTDSFARAQFGSENVHMAARVAEDLPENWSGRVLAGLEAMALLDSGTLTVTAERLGLSGRAVIEDAGDRIARLMTDKLGPASDYDIDITYIAPPPPEDQVPTPEQCEAELAEIVSVAKINFEPGSATIDADAVGTMDDIAEILSDCGDLQLEVQGHTDSQGREQMNLMLSQSRAESVLNELRARNVLTGSFIAKGYGEAKPIADNGTEEGREANRRIEFKLIRPAPMGPERKTTLESVAENSDIHGKQPETETAPETE